MRLVADPVFLPEALLGARREAVSLFGEDALFLERFVLWTRNVKV